MKFCIQTAITFMALSFCSAAVDVAIRGSVAHENDIAELDLATLKHADEYLLHTLDGTSTDANLIAPLVTDLNAGICKYALKSVAHGHYLRAHPGGENSKVDTQTYIGSYEKFTFQNLGSGQHSIRSAHGTYLRAKPGGEGAKVDLQTYVGSLERFQLKFEGVSSNHAVYSFRSIYDTYIRSHPGGEGSKVDQTYVGGWEKFEVFCV